MTAKEFGILADAIKTYFPRDNVLPTENAMQLWYLELKDIPYQSAYMALRKYVSTNKFAPTIADIREQVSELNGRGESELNETAAWSLVLKAIRRSTYYSNEEFAKLPPVVQRAVSSPRQLREWALLEDVDGKTLTVIQSNFQRAFRAEQQREKERSKLSPDILKLMKPIENPKIEEKPKGLSIFEEREGAIERTTEMPDRCKEKMNRLLNEKRSKIALNELGDKNNRTDIKNPK